MLVLKDPDGQPLDALLERPLDVTELLRISIGLANALGRLHERGIIHRDVKPGNVLVDTTSHKVWLTGFGIASDLPRERQSPEPPETIAGTLAYMAPEQTGRMNRSIDSRSDLYSLGVTLYEMLTGVLPFSASNPLDWVHCHIARRPPPPAVWRKEVPEALSAIVLKLLAKTAEKRYQTAAGLEADLRTCLEDWELLGRIRPILPGVHDASDRLLLPEKLYGREREIKALLEAFDRVVARGTPEFVLVSGYSGVGKSSLVNELHKAIVLPRGIFISGKFDQCKRDIPYATFAQAFQTLVRQILSKNEVEVGRWRDAIRAAVGRNGQLVVDLIPELEFIVGKQPPVPELPPREAETRFLALFRAFFGVFAQREHPLALFLDDLQWLDGGTLKLLEHLLTYPDVQYFLLIGAYRENEISLSHPLMLMLEAIRKTGAIVQDIVLATLSLDDVGQFITDSLHQKRERTEPLSRLVHQKTAGNPFFVIQFVTALAEEHLLEFDRCEAHWRWDIDGIRAKRITDNVVDLIIGKMNRLPDTAREALKQLSCLGNKAETVLLTIVRGASEEELHSALREAVREGFVVRQGDAYKFVHDRVQEAAYALIPEEMRAEVHLRIGRLLMSIMPADELAENIFDVVNQLNRGAVLISDPNEKQRVAELNLRAGRKAKASTAYAAACTHLSIGVALIDREDWERNYEFVFGLCLLHAECEFLCGRFDEAERLIARLIERAMSKVDKAAAYRLRTDLRIMKSAYREAVDSALECLRLFGIEMAAHPTREQVQHEYEKVWRNLGEHSIESLINLPPMTDPEIQAAMGVLSVLYSPAYFIDTNLFFQSICHIVNLSLKYGTTDASAHGYAYFGFILGPAFHRYTEGYRFGKLGVDLVEKYEFVAYKAKVYMTMAWVAIWTQPITTALEYIRAAFSAAVQMGDLTYACYCCDHSLTDLLARGDHLDEVWGESEKCLDFVRRAKSPDYVDRIITQQQFIQNMRGRTATFSTFGDSHFDEATFEAQLPGDRAISCWYWILKLRARFISGDYETAMAAAQKAKLLLWAATGCIQLADYNYYTALAMAALFETAPPDIQNEWRKAFAAHLKELWEWVQNCSMTFLDKHALVSAEGARIEGRDFDAMRLYEKAIRYARENGFIQNEALANEIAGRFYLNRGFEMIGYTYLRNARSCYLRWGAQGKVKQFDQLYSGLKEQAPLGSTITMGESIEQLDLATVVKAMQAVSGEIDLGKLIETLMVTAIECGGAERGLLFLPRGQEHGIAAEAATRDDKVQVILAQDFVTLPNFPESILRYVVRTLDSVILDDASAESPFSRDDYVRVRCLRSILCLPVVKLGALIGVLYLENNLTPGVFTPGRLAVLELLASQAAISIENAQLYTDLRQENCNRSRAEEALRASEERMNLAAEAANLAMWEWDVVKDEVWMTARGRALYGLAQDACLNYAALIPLIHPEDRAARDAAIRRALESEGEYATEYRIVLPDGQVRWIAGRGRVEFGSGKPLRMRGVSLDITDRRQAELEAARQRTELAHAARLTIVGELAASIAHEINQPLGAILSNAETAVILLESEEPHLKEVQKILADIRQDNLRASEVIRRMRELLRKRELELKLIDLNAVTSSVLRLVAAETRRRGVKIEERFADNLPMVRGDAFHLQQVLLNLILNGMEAMAESSESNLRLTMRTAYDGKGNVEVAVEDSGPGIAPDRLPRLFDSFFTTKSQGLGLGLSIVRSIVEAHGGRISAENNFSGGACFRLVLPVTEKA
jgi:PAS domain S-box-containing protein